MRKLAECLWRRDFPHRWIPAMMKQSEAVNQWETEAVWRVSDFDYVRDCETALSHHRENSEQRNRWRLVATGCRHPYKDKGKALSSKVLESAWRRDRQTSSPLKGDVSSNSSASKAHHKIFYVIGGEWYSYFDIPLQDGMIHSCSLFLRHKIWFTAESPSLQ